MKRSRRGREGTRELRRRARKRLKREEKYSGCRSFKKIADGRRLVVAGGRTLDAGARRKRMDADACQRERRLASHGMGDVVPRAAAIHNTSNGK